MFNLFIMKHINFNDTTIKKNGYLIDIDQYSIIETLYNNENNENFEREIKKKLNSYKSQDKQKNKFDNDQIITYREIIEKLYDCKLKCYYCECNILILYNKKRDPTQWTLERFDNNKGHYKDNTCISCLKCNLQRRTDNYEYFKYGKQLKINIIK